MATIILRNLDEITARRLKEEAERRRTSVNSLVLELVKSGIDKSVRRRRNAVHHDLDALAGTWSDAYAREFTTQVAPFDRVDPELWR
jgi:hypothetical protein